MRFPQGQKKIFCPCFFKTTNPKTKATSKRRGDEYQHLQAGGGPETVRLAGRHDQETAGLDYKVQVFSSKDSFSLQNQKGNFPMGVVFVHRHLLTWLKAERNDPEMGRFENHPPHRRRRAEFRHL
jgi:hypothetical protein